MPSHKTQVLAWYMWPVGAEVLGVIGTGILVPMILEGIARSVGFWSPDHNIPCSTTKTLGQAVCEAEIFGRWINTNSFAMYSRSVAMITGVFLILAVGTLPDNPVWRKKLLVLSVYIGAPVAMSFYFVPEHPSETFPAIAAGLTSICTTAYIYSTICANGYLPLLARRRMASSTETVVPSPGDLARRDPSPYAHTSHLAERQPLLNRKDSPGTSLITSRMSSLGMACGLVVSVVVQYIVHIALDRKVRMTTCFAACGTWYAIVALPSIIFLPGRKELVAEVQDIHQAQDDRGAREPGHNFKPKDSPRSMGSMIDVVKSIKDLPNLRSLLLNWIIASDVLHVIPTTSILQSITEIGFAPSEVMYLGMIAMGASIVSTTLIPPIQRHLGLTNLQVLAWSVVHVLFYLAFGASSIVNSNWGYHTKMAVYLMLVYVGLGYGVYYSYARAIYAELIPPGRESSFFAMFALTDRSASFFGPLIVAVVTQWTGRFDYAWLVLLVILVLSLPALYFVDVDEGRKQARERGTVERR